MAFERVQKKEYGEMTGAMVALRTSTPKYDTGIAAEFEEEVADILVKGALSLMISIGHRTGLFDTMKHSGDVSSSELALSAGLNERYVREWLGAMYSAGIVEYDQAGERYRLPAEHASCLTRESSPNNLAVMAQYIGILGAVEDEIVVCFRNGGGVSYEEFPRFHSMMAEDSEQTVLSVLLEKIIPLVPGLTARLESGIEVADFGCGRGKALLRMAQAFPASSFTGYELSGEAVSRATREAGSLGLENVRFLQRDLSALDEWIEPGSIDLATTFDAVHDQAKPLSLLKGIFRGLRRDGVYLMQDIRAHSHVHGNRGNPFAPLLYTVSCMHCMTVSLAQGGDGLGAMWGREKARNLLEEAGFSSIEIRELEHDPMNDFYVIRR